jgi:hypothetical protein
MSKVVLTRNNSNVTIGCLTFGVIQSLPLTEDRINAIKSNPLAIKMANFVIKCNICNDEIKAYVGLDRSVNLETEGYIWYKELPDLFVCRCGKSNADLRIAKDNMPALLDNIVLDRDRISLTKMYETEVLENICSRFSDLLNRNPPEERVQEFIEGNPILLQHLSPVRMFYKSPILSKYNTDIVILNQKKELLLIELERPGIQLLKKTGEYQQRHNTHLIKCATGYILLIITVLP